MEKPSFDELKTTGKLPSPSGVALRIMELCRKDDVSLVEIARVAQADPALSGRLLKFANSAMAGPRRPVVAVPDAIRLLGVNTVRQLALGFSIMGQHRSGSCKPFDYGRFWSASLAMGIAANALCLRTRAAPPDEAFTCGLMAKVGTLALASLYPDAYGALIVDGELDSSDLRRREREQLGTDHVELTVALLEEWRLPRVFVQAVLHHENPLEAELPDGSRDALLTQVLHLAGRIARFCVAVDVERRALMPDLIFVGARLGLDADALGLLAAQVAEEWKEWGRILEVKTEDVPALADLARPSREELVAPPAPPQTAPGTATAESKPLAVVAGTSLEPIRILVVDDDATILTYLSRLLSDRGYAVTFARDGREALNFAMKEQPQIIVSDWMMPELDGIGLCRALRETDEGRQMYFMLLTGREEDEDLVEAFEAGVDDFVTKPVVAKVLMARLRAGQRVVRLQREAERDSQSLRRFATELAVANRRLRQAALTDPLTGLPNRRYAMERLEQEWSASSRNQRTFSVMVIDIDRFKSVNDVYGHDTGDQVLRQVAMSLRKAARSEDVVCRLGGEEFLVVLPDTPLTAAARLAERLRVAVGGSPIALGSLRHVLTISIGVAERSPMSAKFDELIKAADEVLYHAKRLGGNRVQAAGQSAAAGVGIGTLA